MTSTSVFDAIEVCRDADPATCRAVIERLRDQQSCSTVCLWLADQAGLDLDGITEALEDAQVQVIGAVFPALILGAEVLHRGALALGIQPPARRVVLRNLFEPTPRLAERLRPLEGEHRTQSALSVLALVDGQAPGASAALVAAARTELLPAAEGGLIGAGAGHWSIDTKGCLFTEGEVLPRGAAVLMALDLPATVALDHGWSVLREPWLANRTRDTTILELDWRPALEVYETAVNGADGSQEASFTERAHRHPLGILNHSGSFSVCEAVAPTDEGGILTLGPIPQFSLLVPLGAHPDQLIGAAEAAAKDVRRRCDAADRPSPKAAVLFSSATRASLLSERFEEELQGISRAVHVPVAGALTLGQIGPCSARPIDLQFKAVAVGVR